MKPINPLSSLSVLFLAENSKAIFFAYEDFTHAVRRGRRATSLELLIMVQQYQHQPETSTARSHNVCKAGTNMLSRLNGKKFVAFICIFIKENHGSSTKLATPVKIGMGQLSKSFNPINLPHDPQILDFQNQPIFTIVKCNISV